MHATPSQPSAACAKGAVTMWREQKGAPHWGTCQYGPEKLGPARLPSRAQLGGRGELRFWVQDAGQRHQRSPPVWDHQAYFAECEGDL